MKNKNADTLNAFLLEIIPHHLIDVICEPTSRCVNAYFYQQSPNGLIGHCIAIQAETDIEFSAAIPVDNRVLGKVQTLDDKILSDDVMSVSYDEEKEAILLCCRKRTENAIIRMSELKEGWSAMESAINIVLSCN